MIIYPRYYYYVGKLNYDYFFKTNNNNNDQGGWKGHSPSTTKKGKKSQLKSLSIHALSKMCYDEIKLNQYKNIKSIEMTEDIKYELNQDILNQDKISLAIFEWMQLSFFGLYPHVTYHLDIDRRNEWYTFFYQNPLLHTTFCLTIIRRHSLLILFVIREYFIHLCYQDYGLLQNVIETFEIEKWNIFVKTTFDAINKIRQYINLYGWAVLIGPAGLQGTAVPAVDFITRMIGFKPHSKLIAWEGLCPFQPPKNNQGFNEIKPFLLCVQQLRQFIPWVHIPNNYFTILNLKFMIDDMYLDKQVFFKLIPNSVKKIQSFNNEDIKDEKPNKNALDAVQFCVKLLKKPKDIEKQKYSILVKHVAKYWNWYWINLVEKQIGKNSYLNRYFGDILNTNKINEKSTLQRSNYKFLKTKEINRLDLNFLIDQQEKIHQILFSRGVKCFTSLVTKWKSKNNNNINVDQNIELDNDDAISIDSEMEVLDDTINESNNLSDNNNDNYNSGGWKGHSPSTSSTDKVHFGVTRLHYLLLEEWISGQITKTRQGGSKAMIFLPLIGMSFPIYTQLLTIKDSYEIKTSRQLFYTKHFEDLLSQIETTNPYSICLIKAFSYLWERHCNISIYPLYLSITENQIRAIKHRASLHLSDEFPYELSILKFCPLCNIVYSPYHDDVYSNANLKQILMKKLNSIKKKQRTAVPCNAGTAVPCNPANDRNDLGGWKGRSPSYSPSSSTLRFLSDLMTTYNNKNSYLHLCWEYGSDVSYCKHSKNKLKSHQYFKSSKVKEISLLNTVLEQNKRLWTICPQPFCGHISIIRFDKAIYTEYGICCTICSEIYIFMNKCSTNNIEVDEYEVNMNE